MTIIIQRFFITAVLLLGAVSVQAANHYIRAGAAGSANGNDWTNAYTALPATLIRGDVYYVAGGSYAGMTLNTPASGSLLITIIGATVADHGSDVGWNSGYGVENAQVTWTSGFIINTSYWIFDGSVGPTLSKTPAQYGFKFNSMQYPMAIYNTSTAISDITISHIAATAPTGDVERFFVETDNATKSVNNVTISHNYGSGWSNFIWATSAGLAMNSWVVEYNVVLDGYSSAANHGENINNNFSNMTGLTVRYNWFEGRTSGTACIVVLNGDAGDYYIYGNVFKDMEFGDGCITGVINGYGTQEMSGVVYNNTFINVQSPYSYGGWIGTAVLSTVSNNLLYNMMADMRSNPPHDYNAYFATTNTPAETNRQTGTGNPFKNLAAGDLTLLAATNAGTSLPAPYNVDAFGKVRGADGVWDRGAFEFTSGSGPAPNPPPAAPKGLRTP